MAKTSHVGNEKYRAGFWIIEAAGLDVVLRVAAEGSKACNRKIEVRRNAAKSRRPRLRPAQVSGDGFDEPGRSQPADQNFLERHPGRGVGSGQRCS
jgi:hypothetical protein